MRTLIISIGIFFITTLAYALPYPADIPDNFQQANIHVFCEQREQTFVYQRVYIMPEQWLVVMIGKDVSDLLLMYFGFQGNDRIYAMTLDGWKKINPQESHEQMSHLFTSEELKFLKTCNTLR